MRRPKTKGLPLVDGVIDPERTALVAAEPLIKVLSEKGATSGVVGESATDRATVANIGRLFAAARFAEARSGPGIARRLDAAGQAVALGRRECGKASLVAFRYASINDLPIAAPERMFHTPLGRHPDDQPGFSALGLRSSRTPP